MNPMHLECSRSSPVKNQPAPTIIGDSYLESIDNLKTQIRDYFRDIDSTKKLSYLAAIRGEAGSGKTLFARNLIEQLVTPDDEDDEDLPSFKNTIFCSSLNSESQYQFLNVWKPILKQMATQFCKREKITREQLIQTLIRLDSEKNEKYIAALSILFQADPKQCYKGGESLPF